MKRPALILVLACVSNCGLLTYAQVPQQKTSVASGKSSPATENGIRIVQRAEQILSAPGKWNHADTGECPDVATSFSLRCALKKARNETGDTADGESAVMGEARTFVDEIGATKYDQRLVDYNSDPSTTFADIQAFLRFLQNRITRRLAESEPSGAPSAEVNNDDPDSRPPVTKADLEIAQRAKEILSSPPKWNRADTRECPADAKTFSIYCALEKATGEVSGNFQHRGAAMQEARFVIDDTAPNAKKYSHRLMDYNNDPTTTFADLQNFFRVLEDRIAKRISQ